MFSWFKKKSAPKPVEQLDPRLQEAVGLMQQGARHFVVRMEDGKRYLVKRIGFDL